MDKPVVLSEKIEIKSPTIETYRWASNVCSRLDYRSFLIVLASADFLYQRQGTGATFFCLSVTLLRINTAICYLDNIFHIMWLNRRQRWRLGHINLHIKVTLFA